MSFSVWLTSLIMTISRSIRVIFCHSIVQLCLTLCNPTDCSLLGFPVLHYLLEFAQTNVHWVNDAIQWTHLVSPFSSCPQSFPASLSFPMSWLFPSCGQSIGASASVSVLPMNIQDWFPLGLTGLILQSKGLPRVGSSKLQTGVLPVLSSSKVTILLCSVFLMVQIAHPYMTTEKKHSFDYTDLCQQSYVSVF